MKQIEVKAKTLHDAIEDAATQFGVDQDQLNIEVLSQGGMFGKVKILASVKEDVKPKFESQDVRPPKPEPKVETKAREAGIKTTSQAKKEEKVVEQKKQDSVTAPIKSIKTERSAIGKFNATQAFIVKLLELLDNDSVVTTEDTDTSFNINVNGENIGRLIGKNGIVLNAIQTLVSSIAISNSHGEGKRVFVNIGDYKEKRGDSLQSLAQKKAEYVKRTGKFIKLEPMNARDRAIVHTSLSGVEGIKTYSTGRDPFRCLCIAPADKT